MRLGWKLIAVAVAGGVWAAPALAFGKKNGCCGTTGTAGGTTVSVPTTVTSTRMTTLSVPTAASTFVNSSVFATPTFTFTPNVVTFTPLSATFGGTASGYGDLGGVTQALTANTAALQNLNATLTTTNAQLARLVGTPIGGGGEVPVPPVPSDPLTFARPMTAFGQPTTAAGRLKAEFDAYIAAGNRTEAKYLYEKGREIENRWKSVNDEMEAKLKELGVLPKK